MIAPRPTLKARLHRWRWWLLTGGVLLAIRIALPEVVRRVLISQASQALHAQVDIGNVDLALLRGGVALEDVAVRAPSQPPSAVPPATDTPTQEPALIAWKRLAVELRYLPLFRKTIRLREVLLDSPQVALDRLQDGTLNLLALVPASSEPPPVPSPTAAPAAPPAAGWGFGLDRFVLTGGGLRFRDLTLQDSEAIEVNLDAVEIADIALRPGVYGEPAHVRVMLEVDDGSLTLDATLSRHDAGFSLDASLDAQALPLPRARLYIPRVGWSSLNGWLDGALTYRFETGTRSEVRGIVSLRDLQVWLPDLQDPALAWRTLTVRVDPVDLIGHRVVVADGALDGASLLVRPGRGVLLPLLAMQVADADAAADEAAPDAASTTTPPAEPAAAADTAPPAGDATPWQWALTTFRLTDSLVHVVGAQAGVDVGVGLTANDFAGEAGHLGHLNLGLTAAGGSLDVAGALRLLPLGFAGTLHIADLSLPELIAVAPSAPPVVVETARLGTDLKIEAGLTVEADASKPLAADDVRVSGSVSVAEPYIAVEAPGASFSAQSIDLTLREINAPGVLPQAHREAAGESASNAPGAVHVQGGLAVIQPRVSVKGAQELSVDAESINLALSDLAARGLLARSPTAAQAQSAIELHTHGTLSLAGLKVAAPGQGFSAAAHSVDLTLSDVGAVGAAETGSGGLAVAQLQVSVQAPQEMSVDVDSINLAVADLAAHGLLTLSPTEAAAQTPSDLRTQGKLSVAGLKISAPGPQGFSAATRSIDLTLSELGAAGLFAPHDGAASVVETGSAGLMPGDLHMRGRLGLAEFQLTGADAKVFAVGARAVDLPFTEINLPGVLPGKPAGAVARPLKLALGDFRLTAPSVQVTRTTDGLLMPQCAGPQSPAPAAAPSTPAAVATPPTPAPGSVPAQRVEASLDSFKLVSGRVDLVDQTTVPVFKGSMTPLDLDLRSLRWPPLTVRDVRGTLYTPGQGKIDVFGGLTASDGWLELYGDDVALLPFNPYAIHYSTYRIGNGQLVLSTKIAKKQGQYTASTVVTLHDFDLQGAEGDSLFQKEFGVPLTLALALMRDLQSNIVLDIPVESGAEGTTVDVLSVVGGALRHAIVNALESPLKLVGAVFGGGAQKSVAPAPITFRLGRADFTPEGTQQVERLGSFLSSRPGIGATIDVTTSTSDARWLREQALRAEWEAEGVLAKLRGLAQGSTRDRVRQALEARAKDEAGELQADDAAALDRWLDERPPIAPDQLRTLAEARLAKLGDALHAAGGIDPSRIVRGEPPSEATEGPPTATVQLGAGGH